ncbi:hypothetical protein STCU_00780 [Strigomonas culicis]|uniref:Uncharacterized protein n=1 Tax=Strigomonas culicis TaxID=28005 RepID=S9WJD9_9TRYP|nr:hypothetical protein STCU_02947 [Strigomonas culicis]EPY36050.1 hypothetical protein STCU_00780 [Strigomonas culicis]|eukprot:EPY32158.1 hypothetical protein STCU_02947 [Strigomonas culicis]
MLRCVQRTRLLFCVGASRSCSSKGTASKQFNSRTKFKLTPDQVNESNVPSSAEVAELIPTLRELKKQLPSARELESKYIEKKPITENWKPSDEETSEVFQKTTDPFEDLLETPEDGKRRNKSTREHLLLAYRALLWGTFFAIVGFLTTVGLAMLTCGYHSIGELMDGVRAKVERDEKRLITKARESSGGEEVVHYVIDLSSPAAAMRQAQDIWNLVQDMAQKDEADTSKN